MMGFRNVRSGEAEGVSAVRASIGASPTTLFTSAFAEVTNLTAQTLTLILLVLVNMTLQLIICAFVVHVANNLHPLTGIPEGSKTVLLKEGVNGKACEVIFPP